MSLQATIAPKRTHQVRNWFQAFAFSNFSLYRYAAEMRDALVKELSQLVGQTVRAEVRLCTLNQVDTYPITYSLSNP
jgi:hypothetical protein